MARRRPRRTRDRREHPSATTRRHARCGAELGPAGATCLFAAFKRTTDIVAGVIAEGYHQAVEEVTGMRGALLGRMADVAVDRLLANARGEAWR